MTIDALISDLHNPDDDVRWKAAERLAAWGPPAVDAVLEDLVGSLLDEKLRQSYLYIFEQQWDAAIITRLQPVLEALHGIAFRAESPVAAEKALQARARR
jgi:HEAT repeat protein